MNPSSACFIAGLIISDQSQVPKSVTASWYAFKLPGVVTD